MKYNTKCFTLFPEIFCEKTTEIIQYFMIFDQVFPKYFHISHVSRICQCFNYITHFTMFTMFHNISRKICPNFLVKYCALSSQKWQHWFAAATRAVRIPYATMLTASNLSQSYQNHNLITTHWPSEFASIHSISKTIRTSCDIAIVLEEGSPFAKQMLLAYQNSSCFLSFLRIICSLAWNVSALLRTWVLGR